MPIIDRVDGPSRRIYLHADTAGTALDLLDLYRELRALRRTDESIRPFPAFLEMQGNLSKGAGSFTERFMILRQGTKIVPADSGDHSLSISTTLIGDDGSVEGPGQFDRSAIASRVDIAYAPKQVEVLNQPDPATIAAAVVAAIGDVTRVIDLMEADVETQGRLLILRHRVTGDILLQKDVLRGAVIDVHLDEDPPP